MSKYGEHFAESNALLAAMNGDTEELTRLLSEMLVGELLQLEDGTDDLATAVVDELRRRSQDL